MFELIMLGLFCLLLGILIGAIILFLVFRNNPTLLAAWVAELAKAQTVAAAVSAEVKKF